MWCIWKKNQKFWVLTERIVTWYWSKKKCLIILFFCFFFRRRRFSFFLVWRRRRVDVGRACILYYIHINKFYIIANESHLIRLHCTVIVRYVLLLWSWTLRGNLQSVKINCDRRRRGVAVKNRPYYIRVCTYHAIM